MPTAPKKHCLTGKLTTQHQEKPESTQILGADKRLTLGTNFIGWVPMEMNIQVKINARTQQKTARNTKELSSDGVTLFPPLQTRHFIIGQLTCSQASSTKSTRSSPNLVMKNLPSAANHRPFQNTGTPKTTLPHGSI